MWLSRKLRGLCAFLAGVGFATVSMAAQEPGEDINPLTPSPYSAMPDSSAVNICGLVQTNVSDPDWVLATSDYILRSGVCVAPCAASPNSWYEKVFSPCYNGVRYFKFSNGSKGGFAFTMSTLGLGTFDGLYVRSGAYQLFDKTGKAYGSGGTGPQYFSLTYWRDTFPACLGFEAGTILVPGAPGDLGLYSIVLGPKVDVLAIDARKRENHRALRTDAYRINDTPRLIVRRGAKFKINLSMNSSYNKDCYTLSFQATHGFGASPVNIDIPSYDTTIPSGVWGCRVVKSTAQPDGSQLVEMEIQVPAAATAGVGKYDFKVQMKRKDATEVIAEKAFDEPVYILFNPLSADDSVQLTGSSNLNEYVFNETGRLWQANKNGLPIARDWRYRQFDEVALDTTLDQLAGMTAAQRADSALVSRRLSERVNSAAPGGILRGKWDEPYTGGVLPWNWTGSDQIFAAYKSGGEVKFGQCWVFAGVLTSSLRTVGIPARPVTNFSSAHDRNIPSNLAVDKYFKRAGPTQPWTLDQAATADSIWNFHVWAEGWMKRGSFAWQALDATPQELSDGVYQLGPAAVPAVKARSGGAYDVAFVTAEVDADVNYYIPDGSGGWTLVKTDATVVGKGVLTKATGGNGADDITVSYKTPEAPTPPDVAASLSVAFAAPDTVSPGESITAAITLTNPGPSDVSTSYTAAGFAIAYDETFLGVATAPLVSTVVVPAGETVVRNYVISASDVLAWTSQNASFRVDFGVEAGSPVETFVGSRAITLTPPQVSVTLQPADIVLAGQSVLATIQFTNPLNVPMTNAQLLLTGDTGMTLAGLSSEAINLGTIAPNGLVQVTRSLAVTRAGQHLLTAQISSDQVRDTLGAAEILAVPCAADYNEDNSLDFIDFDDFIADYEAGATDADFNNDGFLTFEDFDAFVTAFQTGC